MQQDVRIGLVITVKDRPELTRECFKTLCKSYIPKSSVIIVVDDNSYNYEVKEIIKNFRVPNIVVYKITNKITSGVGMSLFKGFEKAKTLGVELLVNLDNDTIVKEYWLEELLKVYNNIEEKLGLVVTGFNTQNIDLVTRQIRHKIIQKHETYIQKKTIGGVNMLFNIGTYEKYIKPNLLKQGHWDWAVCKSGAVFYCTRPSVIQHTGVKEGTNLNNPDIAHDF